ISVEGRPVVERHPLAEVEGVDRTVRLSLPRFRQGADQLVGAARSKVDEGLVDLAQDPERLAVAGQRRVEAGRQARAAEDERSARLAGALTGARLATARRWRPGPAPSPRRRCRSSYGSSMNLSFSIAWPPVCRRHEVPTCCYL